MDELSRFMAETERRLRALETAPRANKTATADGHMLFQQGGTGSSVAIGSSVDLNDVGVWVRDDVGEDSIVVGTWGGRSSWVWVANPDKTAPAVNWDDGQWAFPRFAAAWQKEPNAPVDANGRAVTTSGSYETLWRAILPVATTRVFANLAVAPGASTASVRIQMANLHNLGDVDTVVEWTGITADADYVDTWDVPAGIKPGVSPVGVVALVSIDACRTSGADPVAVAPRMSVTNIVG